MSPSPLSFSDSVIELLAQAGHPQQVDVWADDGFSVVSTDDSEAIEVCYTIRPAHRADTTNHYRCEKAVNEVAQLLRDAGYPVTRISIRRDRSLIVFAAPVPEPVPVDPAVCGCASADRRAPVCDRARRRVEAALALRAAVEAGTSAFLDGLHQAAVELVSHAVGGPESAAALLRHSRGLLVDAPALDRGLLEADLECTGCVGVACTEANGWARTVLAAADRLEETHRTLTAAARLFLDRAEQNLTPGNRWDKACRDASQRLAGVYTTGLAALQRPRVEEYGRSKHRMPTRVDLRHRWRKTWTWSFGGGRFSAWW